MFKSYRSDTIYKQHFLIYTVDIEGDVKIADFYGDKRVFDLVKDFGTSQSIKIDSIFNSLLCYDRPAYVTIPYCTSTASCSCTTPS
ncbi:MAG: hypothetical protein KZQ60_07045 [Candidatus Thiodiazotropha sp. (ex Lucinoma aequizonata)]|nr:hypothetical protein [Candidatus Thiodiazotropha sp. (ex Lucinoma aequizonata)]MCU7913698.1 hypothetical protein [Candidatus Thiodiazotropha sp. (ex Lucinoma aequizonata)]